MAYPVHLTLASALMLLALPACNPTATPTSDAALGVDQNSAAAAATNNQEIDGDRADGMDDDHRGSEMMGDDHHRAEMMHDNMMKDDKHGMGGMAKGNMPAMGDDAMSNSQSKKADEPMAHEMEDM